MSKPWFSCSRGHGTELIPKEMPRVDWSDDGGKTWDCWVYFRPGQIEQVTAAFNRLIKVYPEWKFRMWDGSKLTQ